MFPNPAPLKNLGICFAVAGVLFCCAGNTYAESGPQPGQLAAQASQTHSLFEARPMEPATQLVRLAEPAHSVPLIQKAWWVSAGALVGASGLDAASSWGHREANGFLASQNGNFGPKGALLKLGGASAMLVPQFTLRHHPRVLRVFALTNAAEAGMYSAAAVHNFNITSH